MATLTLQPDAAAGIDCVVRSDSSSTNYPTDTLLRTGRTSYSCNCYSCNCDTCCYSCSYSCNCSTCSYCGPGGPGTCFGGYEHNCGSGIRCFYSCCDTCNGQSCPNCGSYSCSCSTCCSTCYNGPYRSFIRFPDISQIPPGSIINSAVLSFYSVDSVTSGTVDLYLVTSGWTETQPTWSAQPTMGGAALVSATPVGNSQWQDFSIQTQLKRWIDGLDPNYGVAVRRSSDTTSEKDYASSDYATANLRPKLVVDYTPAGTGWGVVG